MKRVLNIFAAGVVIMATPLLGKADVDWAAFTHDVVILGEYHDNPAHHQRQQSAISRIEPKAVVFEMLTPEEASRLANVPRDRDAMRIAIEGFHWNNINDYAGILSDSAVIVGAALSRAEMREAFSKGAAVVFGKDAGRYGLLETLPEDQLEVRMHLQFEAHCAAMPLEMMAGMVEAQRLRDAAFARTVLDAVESHGTPVVLITGNGHARTDSGVPAFLARVRPDLSVASIAQGENDSAPPGTFDATILNAEPPDRGDPCDAFR